jgi:hypothetical protein
MTIYTDPPDYSDATENNLMHYSEEIMNCISMVLPAAFHTRIEPAPTRGKAACARAPIFNPMPQINDCRLDTKSSGNGTASHP